MATRSTIALGLIGMAMALAACSQEDYYCDLPGEGASCYLCDGLGCRPLTAPDRPACDCDDQCGSGSCTELGCTKSCSAVSDCPRGTVCGATGWCVHPSETSPAAASIACSCSTGDDCAAYGLEGDFVCVDSMCVPTEMPACDDGENACTGGRLCVDGECRTPDDTCQFSSQCGAGRVCVNQQCTTACTATSGCATGSTCQAGYCVEDAPTASCTENTDCDAGSICVDGACWEGCAADTDCGEGRYCAADGRCRVDDRPDPQCGPDVRECVGNNVCIAGVCRSPCKDITDCQRFDVQFTVCGSDRLCYTTNEATTNCSSAGDCEATQACVDGRCQ